MSGWVYIMASKRNGTIYIGVTSDLQGRAHEHRTGQNKGFTTRYNCKDLVWYERHENIVLAIEREKKLKKFKRAWKLELIEGFNPDWEDLYENCYLRDNPSDEIRDRV